MIPKNRIPTHPGEMLLEEFLRPLEISQTRFAEQIGVDPSKVSALVNEKMSVTPVMAWKLARALGTTPEFWMSLQVGYDLAKARDEAPAVKPLPRVIKPSSPDHTAEGPGEEHLAPDDNEVAALKHSIGQAQAFLERVRKMLAEYDTYGLPREVIVPTLASGVALEPPNAWQALSDDVRRALAAYEREPEKTNAQPETPSERQRSS